MMWQRLNYEKKSSLEVISLKHAYDTFPSNLSFLEGDEEEDTCTISQQDIADAVDITSASKVAVQMFEGFTSDI